jgi:hypothetical protein
VNDRGHYADVPYEAILADFRRVYPRWLELGARGQTGDFAAEASADS